MYNESVNKMMQKLMTSLCAMTVGRAAEGPEGVLAVAMRGKELLLHGLQGKSLD